MNIKNILEKFDSKIAALGGASSENAIQDTAVKEIMWCKDIVKQEAEVDNDSCIPVSMVKLCDGTYIPQEFCTMTNPTTSGGISEVDDYEMQCGGDCSGECCNCTIQKIFNEYAALTNQL